MNWDIAIPALSGFAGVAITSILAYLGTRGRNREDAKTIAQQVNESAFKTLDGTIERLTEEIDVLHRERKETIDLVTNLSNELKEVKARESASREEADKLREEVKELHQVIDVLRQNIDSQSKNIDSQSMRIKELESEADSSRRRIRDLEAENQRLKNGSPRDKL